VSLGDVVCSFHDLILTRRCWRALPRHGGNVPKELLHWPKDVSRAVAQNAASQTGLELSLLKKMLPILAMLVAGYMAKQRAGAAARPQRTATVADCWTACSAAGPRGAGNDASPGAGGGLASMLDSTATAMCWMTSCAWPGGRCAEHCCAAKVGYRRGFSVGLYTPIRLQ
jgi:hypothetical protein